MVGRRSWAQEQPWWLVDVVFAGVQERSSYPSYRRRRRAVYRVGVTVYSVEMRNSVVDDEVSFMCLYRPSIYLIAVSGDVSLRTGVEIMSARN